MNSSSLPKVVTVTAEKQLRTELKSGGILKISYDQMIERFRKKILLSIFENRATFINCGNLHLVTPYLNGQCLGFSLFYFV